MEEGNFKSIRQSTIVICGVLISLYLLDIDIYKSTPRLPLIGAEINRPQNLLLIIYCIYIYTIWKYFQHLLKKDIWIEHLGFHINKIENFRFLYLSKYAYKYKNKAKEEIKQSYQQELQTFRGIGNERFKKFNNYLVTFTATVTLRPNTNQDVKLSSDIKVNKFKHLPHFIWTEPIYTYYFLPLLFIFIIFILLLLDWDGGLAIFSWLEQLINKWIF